MICERCHKNEASVHTVQIINGEKIEHYYCQNCANETGIDNPISFQDIFQGLLNFGMAKARRNERSIQEFLCEMP